MWIYLQALEPPRLPDDAADLERLFDVDFDELRQRVGAGEAAWLEYDFFHLHELYAPRSEPGGDRELPVLGGRHLPDPRGGPGHVTLDPPDVARAAAYLHGVSFADLWQARARIRPSDPDEELRERLAQDHADLRAFYGRAAERGRAVAKYISC